MVTFAAGLILFLGAHSIRAWGEPVRARLVARLGENRFKGVYALVSALGLILMVWGYGQARASGGLLWVSPVGARHLGTLFTLLGLICLAAAYVPGTYIRAWLGHPMMIGVGLWAVGHLLAKGTVASLLLFGGFLAWVVATYPAARRRDRAAGVTRPPAGPLRDLAAVAVGIGFWGLLAFWLHELVIGVAPFG
jgi:uncharacterized membrane protein